MKIKRPHRWYRNNNTYTIGLTWSLCEHCKQYGRWNGWRIKTTNYQEYLWQYLGKIWPDECMNGKNNLKEEEKHLYIKTQYMGICMTGGKYRHSPEYCWKRMTWTYIFQYCNNPGHLNNYFHNKILY